MNDSEDSMNRSIEDNLRQAHQQVQYRPEWAAKVLSQISCKMEQHSSIDRLQQIVRPISRNPKGSWSKAIALVTGLAAGLLLAVLGSVFLARAMNRSQSTDAAKSLAINPPNELPLDTAPPSASQLDIAQSDSVKSEESVTAGTGYLAAKLTSQAEFEIYVVLPTMTIAGNTK